MLSTARSAIRYGPSHRRDVPHLGRTLARHRTTIAKTILPRAAEFLDRAVATLFTLLIMGAITWGGSLMVRSCTHSLETMAYGAGGSELLPNPIK